MNLSHMVRFCGKINNETQHHKLMMSPLTGDVTSWPPMKFINHIRMHRGSPHDGITPITT